MHARMSARARGARRMSLLHAPQRGCMRKVSSQGLVAWARGPACLVPGRGRGRLGATAVGAPAARSRQCLPFASLSTPPSPKQTLGAAGANQRFRKYLSNLDHFIKEEGRRTDMVFEWTSP